jgi:hypothetical protein
MGPCAQAAGCMDPVYFNSHPDQQDRWSPCPYAAYFSSSMARWSRLNGLPR